MTALLSKKAAPKDASLTIAAQLVGAVLASLLQKALGLSQNGPLPDGDVKAGIAGCVFTLLVCLAISLVDDAALPVAFAMFAGKSHGGLNPAITLAKAVGTQSWTQMLFPYWTFQFIAGALAAVVAKGLEKAELGVKARELQESLMSS